MRVRYGTRARERPARAGTPPGPGRRALPAGSCLPVQRPRCPGSKVSKVEKVPSCSPSIAAYASAAVPLPLLLLLLLRTAHCARVRRGARRSPVLDGAGRRPPPARRTSPRMAVPDTRRPGHPPSQPAHGFLAHAGPPFARSASPPAAVSARAFPPLPDMTKSRVTGPSVTRLFECDRPTVRGWRDRTFASPGGDLGRGVAHVQGTLCVAPAHKEWLGPWRAGDENSGFVSLRSRDGPRNPLPPHWLARSPRSSSCPHRVPPLIRVRSVGSAPGA